ncbi:hypothetical protein CCHR01_19085 [Colletotrichum chrysophilum]|uniref:Uncharacterized protein n=1 Tax=Colletotrichum chrysophilum TaxID=1836956 RepID=A0AAD8ZYW7_9PEZI|nr:hypothetical protein CCHR01_19085 [Colletotrichum chrysophilum]
MYLSSKHSLPTELRRREWKDDAQGKGLWRCTPPPADLGRYTGHKHKGRKWPLASVQVQVQLSQAPLWRAERQQAWMALATLGLLDGLSKGPTPVQFPCPAAADSADEKGGWEET